MDFIVENGFNSLQTGNHIQRTMSIAGLAIVSYSCFNSLQTGNHIQRTHRSPSEPLFVEKFQFPSNGKPYPKGTRMNALKISAIVSIPFKRETISKAYRSTALPKSVNCFNSLQTGNHIQRNDGTLKLTDIIEVGFNSLQTGNHIQSMVQQFTSERWDEFQFPSNGKAYPKRFEIGIIKRSERYTVSIPFKREGISKAESVHSWRSLLRCFNSLQTGRHIQRKNFTMTS